MDRKTVRKYLKQAPSEYERKPKSWQVDPHRSYLRERWELGVHNAAKLFVEIRKRGYGECETQVKKVVRPWRSEGQERAFVRFETAPGEQAQMDWGHFGNWGGRRLYGFALTLCSSRMRYVEFTQRQDAETLLNCMVHAFEFFGGVTRTVLTDNMKTVVVDRVDGHLPLPSDSVTRATKAQDRADPAPGTAPGGRCRGVPGSSSQPARGRDGYFRQIRPPWPAS